MATEILDFNAADALYDSVATEFKPRMVRGRAIPMQPLAFDDWMYLIRRFPQVSALFDGWLPSEEDKPETDWRSLFKNIGNEPIAAIVAGVQGRLGDETAENRFLVAPPSLKDELGIVAMEAAFGEDGMAGFFSMFSAGLERVMRSLAEQEAPARKSGRKTASKKAATSSAS